MNEVEIILNLVGKRRRACQTRQEDSCDRDAFHGFGSRPTGISWTF
jgi:hypothetical protein